MNCAYWLAVPFQYKKTMGQENQKGNVHVDAYQYNGLNFNVGAYKWQCQLSVAWYKQIIPYLPSLYC